MTGDERVRDEHGGRVPEDLRQRIARVLFDRAAAVAADVVAVFPFSGAVALDAEYCAHVGDTLVHLLAFAVRDGRADSRGGLVADLHRLVVERGLALERLFTFAYLVERTALDELAVDERLGATAEAWPVVAQIVRRASFDVLGAYTERAQIEPSGAAITDRLTTLYTRPMFEAVLAKELERAGRFGTPVALMLFDIDRLSQINKEHGYGVGDRIIERVGITLGKYFRQHDWVARHSEDSIAVLLIRTEPDNAADLAERARIMVAERLALKDHRDDRTMAV